MNDPDHDLIREFATQRSEQAFRRLVDRHCDLVYSVARRVTGDADLSRDVSQQVFCKLAAKPGSIPPAVPLVAWLHRTTRSLAVDLVRSEQSRRTRESLTLEPMQSTPAPDWSRLEPVIDALIDELPEADRRAVILRFYEKRSHGAIGVALGLSEEAARKRLDRALEKLRAMLAKRGIATTSAALATILPAHATSPAPAGLAASISSTAFSTAAITVTEATIIAAIMSHKAIIAGASLLLLAGVTAVAVPKFTRDNSAAASAVTSPASQNSNRDRENDADAATASRSKTRGGAGSERLTAQYGDSRTKLSAHLYQEFIGMLEDSLSVMDLVHKMELGEAMAGDSEEALGEVGATLALTDEQKKEIADLQVDAMKREVDKTRANIAKLQKDPSKMMEYLLMQDAVKRGEASQADFDQFKKTFDVPDAEIELSIGSSEEESPLDDEAFVKEVLALLDEEQAKAFEESLGSRPAADAKPGSPEAEELMTLEEVEEKLSGGRKMIRGAIQMIEGMTNSGLMPEKK